MNFNPTNNKIKNSLNYISSKMPSAHTNHPNPVETLSVDDINYIQKYLEQIKSQKLQQYALTKEKLVPKQMSRINDTYDPIPREMPIDWRDLSETNSRNDLVAEGARRHGDLSGRGQDMSTRKKTQNDYYNPYEYGSRQSMLEPANIQPYHGPYFADKNLLSNMALPLDAPDNRFPNEIRNVNIESNLIQGEMTHGPGQRRLTEKETNRFQLLPFDPQDHRHLVWTDNMPRGGYPTRTDRYESYQ